MKIYVRREKERAKRPLSIELFIIRLREGTETLPYNERYWYFVEAIHELPVKLCKIADIAGFAETVKDFGCVNTLS